MLAQPDHRLHRYIDAGGLRPVVDDQRDLGLVGDGAEVEHLRVGAVDQILIVVGRAYHRRLITHFGGAIGQHHALAGGTHHDVAGEGGEVPFLHVVLDLGTVNVPVVVEWGGDWWENTL